MDFINEIDVAPSRLSELVLCIYKYQPVRGSYPQTPEKELHGIIFKHGILDSDTSPDLTISSPEMFFVMHPVFCLGGRSDNRCGKRWCSFIPSGRGMPQIVRMPDLYVLLSCP